LLRPGYDPAACFAAPGLALVVGPTSARQTAHVVMIAARLAAAGREVHLLSVCQELGQLVLNGLTGVAVECLLGGDDLVVLVDRIAALSAGAVLIIDDAERYRGGRQRRWRFREHAGVSPRPRRESRVADFASLTLSQAAISAQVTVIAVRHLGSEYDLADSLEALPRWVRSVACVVMTGADDPAPSSAWAGVGAILDRSVFLAPGLATPLAPLTLSSNRSPQHGHILEIRTRSC
jgi:hypothetical protein